MSKVVQFSIDGFLPVICGNAFVAAGIAKSLYCADQSLDHTVIVENKYNTPSNWTVCHEGVPIYALHLTGTWTDVEASIMKYLSDNDVRIGIWHEFGAKKAYDEVAMRSHPKNMKKISLHHFMKDESMVRKELKIFDAIIVFQEEHKRLYDLYLDENEAKKITFIPHPVSDVFTKTDLDTWRGRDIIYAGRIIDAKGAHRIIPYLKALGATLTIAGPKPDSDYEAKLRGIIDEYCAEDRVRLRFGNYSHEELAEMFIEHKVFFLGSTSDCYSLVAQEAMASGCLLLAFRQVHAYHWAEPYAAIFREDSELLDLMTGLLDNDSMDGAMAIREIACQHSVTKRFKQFLQDIGVSKKEKEIFR